ncbi:MAG: hypothetical protein DDG59_07725 [Anaerolineae bacterium]|jgi:hypothetical protein|nr:MAG: hypothetical protein DDG59_07725 [Anaerolineae bacterium]
MKTKTFPSILPLLALGIAALLLALWSGLVRLGWHLPSFAKLTVFHGGLILNGFLGVLIPLERVVALQRRWMILIPCLNGVGWMLWFGSPQIGQALFLLGSLGMIAILGVMFKREPQLHTATLLTGGLSWAMGNALWFFGVPIYGVVLWWLAFLVLTISGERLELNRVLRLSNLERTSFMVIISLIITAAILSIFHLDWGARLSGVGYLSLMIWFVAKDIAFRNLRHPQPLTQFISTALAAGFLWLGIGGLLLIYLGKVTAGVAYDAVLHSIFVGFVGSMIFGHAPIIFPALFGMTARFSPMLYYPLGLLHLSLILRLLGDFVLHEAFRRWGGLFNVIAALVYFGLNIRMLLGKER